MRMNLSVVGNLIAGAIALVIYTTIALVTGDGLGSAIAVGLIIGVVTFVVSFVISAVISRVMAARH